jgi:wyosine [tRNA(Phe)-imidazoG37] synthetase (radical SAM superfamily)
MTPRVLDHADHRRDLGDNLHVYAVVSRRARGLSIGVNLNADKVCNFDCPYCQVDRTTPGGSADVDLGALERELSVLLGWVRDGTLWAHAPFDTAAPEHRRVADIAFAGDGEPTSARAFPEAVALVRRVRDAMLGDGGGALPPLRLLTNGTLLHRERVRAALPGLDEVWFKLDAGTEDYFRVVDGTTFPFARILRNLRELACARPVVVQSMFLALDGVGPSDAEVTAWAARLAEVRAAGGAIDRVQVYTVARTPADPRVGPLPRARLEQVADAARADGLVVEVHG